MTHDPLCNAHGEEHADHGLLVYECACDLIARVREDERGKSKDVAGYVSWANHGYADALRDAAAAISADSEFDDVRDQWHAIEIIEALGGER